LPDFHLHLYFVKIYYIATGVVPVESFGLYLLKDLLSILRDTLPSAWIKALPKYDQGDFSELLSFPLFKFAPPDGL
jgi:hypothetical protein